MQCCVLLGSFGRLLDLGSTLGCDHLEGSAQPIPAQDNQNLIKQTLTPFASFVSIAEKTPSSTLVLLKNLPGCDMSGRQPTWKLIFQAS